MEQALPGGVVLVPAEARVGVEVPGRMKGTSPGSGPGGDCVCPSCGARVAHQVRTPCYSVSCPKCGAKMVKG